MFDGKSLSLQSDAFCTLNFGGEQLKTHVALFQADTYDDLYIKNSALH